MAAMGQGGLSPSRGTDGQSPADKKICEDDLAKMENFLSREKEPEIKMHAEHNNLSKFMP